LNSCVKKKWRQFSFRSTLDEAAMFHVTIDDDGPGLAAGLRQAALSRGKRLDETKPGSGLGLSIVGDLASLYGGDLSLEDSPKGELRRGPQAARGMRSTD
jgi:signal transduction histidine kinase